MSTAITTQSSQDVYAALGLNSPNSSASKKKDTLEQADFLRLMTEQLQHQDPLKPMDNTQMVAQMAQFSALPTFLGSRSRVSMFRRAP